MSSIDTRSGSSVVELALLRPGALVHRQRQPAGQRHHPEVGTILALEKGRGVRLSLGDDVLRAGVAGKDLAGEDVDVHLGLRKVRNVARLRLRASDSINPG